MSDESDSTPARNHSQAISSDNGGIPYFVSGANQDTFALVNRILSWVVRILESKSMQALEGRISLLVCGGWLPGLGDVRTVAALTGKAERTIEDAVTNSPRQKHYIGRQVFYRLSDFPMANAEPGTSNVKNS